MDTAVLCCIFWDPHLTVLCAHSFSCMVLICKGYIQNFSLWHATICLFVFVKWVFTMSPGLMSSFWGPRDASDSTSDITAQARASTSGFRQLLWKPLRSTSWTFICVCVGLYVFCLNTLEESRSGIVGRGSVCHSASASKHTCIYRISGQGHHGWSKECLAKADDHYICGSKVINIPTYEILANAN